MITYTPTRQPKVYFINTSTTAEVSLKDGKTISGADIDLLLN